jgi:hypothetical protein
MKNRSNKSKNKNKMNSKVGKEKMKVVLLVIVGILWKID